MSWLRVVEMAVAFAAGVLGGLGIVLLGRWAFR